MSEERGERSWPRLIPGVALLFAVGWLGKWCEFAMRSYGTAHNMKLPNIEYVLWAILIGLVIGNVFGGRRWFVLFEPGIATYEFWLKIGIVLLGVRFLLADVVRLGGVSLILVILEIAIAMAIMIWLGRRFRLGAKLSALLAIGSSVCGVSAIIAAQGAIDADERDTTFAIAAVLLLGAISLVVFPIIGHAFGMSDHAYGMWVGLAVDNTAEVTAAGALYSDEAGRVAVLAKTVRNATIGFVVLAAALWFATRGGHAVRGSKAAFVWEKFPKFVLGFLLFSAVASTQLLSGPAVASLANLSRWAFLLTFAGVGLRTNIPALLKQGLGPFVVGALGEIAIAVVTLFMVLIADHTFGLG